MRFFLTGSDYELKLSAALVLSHLSVPASAKVPIAQSGVLVPLIKLCLPDNEELNFCIARVVAEAQRVLALAERREAPRARPRDTVSYS